MKKLPLLTLALLLCASALYAIEYDPGCQPYCSCFCQQQYNACLTGCQGRYEPGECTDECASQYLWDDDCVTECCSQLQPWDPWWWPF